MRLTEHQLRRKIRNALQEIFGIERKGPTALQQAFGGKTPKSWHSDDWDDEDSYEEITAPYRERSSRDRFDVATQSYTSDDIVDDDDEQID